MRPKELKATGEKRAGVDSPDKIFFPALSSFFFGFFGLLGLSLYSGCYLLKDAEIFRALGITVRAPLSMLGFFGFSFFFRSMPFLWLLQYSSLTIVQRAMLGIIHFFFDRVYFPILLSFHLGIFLVRKGFFWQSTFCELEMV